MERRTMVLKIPGLVVAALALGACAGRDLTLDRAITEPLRLPESSPELVEVSRRMREIRAASVDQLNKTWPEDVRALVREDPGRYYQVWRAQLTDEQAYGDFHAFNDWSTMVLSDEAITGDSQHRLGVAANMALITDLDRRVAAVTPEVTAIDTTQYNADATKATFVKDAIIMRRAALADVYRALKPPSIEASAVQAMMFIYLVQSTVYDAFLSSVSSGQLITESKWIDGIKHVQRSFLDASQTGLLSPGESNGLTVAQARLIGAALATTGNPLGFVGALLQARSPTSLDELRDYMSSCLATGADLSARLRSSFNLNEEAIVVNPAPVVALRPSASETNFGMPLNV